MTSKHIHLIDHHGRIVGTAYLGEDGYVKDDGTPSAINAIDHTPHGHTREDGEDLLKAIVRHLDNSTMVGAYHCDEDDIPGHHKAKDEPSSTEPTPVNNPDDHWPDFGETPPDKNRKVQVGTKP